jgi:single-stranded-DNA-specific exonuclease
MEKRWVIRDADEDKVNSLQQDLKVHPVICRLLVQRGIYTYDAAKKFFRPTIEDLHDPFLMKDMDKAIQRIDRAIANNERILIYGDYDVDGTTSVALAYSFFRSVYSNIDFYIPDRYLEGYGISIKGIDYAKETNCSLVIALDCGIKAVDKMEYANSIGVDFVICDHHIPGETIPAAFAVLDPHQSDCNYPYKELSGCGIGFKLIQAYAQAHQIPVEKIIPYLDLVVVSIASDIVPITGENRVLAFYGIEQLNKNPRPGLKALIEIAGYEGKLNISNIVFGLGPRINAAGRMDDANKAVRMLIAETVEHAKDGADVLHEKNVDRKEVDKKITSDALHILQTDPETENRVSTVLCSSEWHKGVIGIVASRMLDHYYRPTILLTESAGMLYGSARSVKNFDIYEAIKACADLLEQFGGHMYAAGLSLKPENFELFRKRFDDVVRASIKPEQLIPEIEIDAAISLKDITPTFNNIIKQFAPFGPLNMDPIFMSAELLNNGKSRIVGDNHLKLGLKDNERFNAEGIAFQKGVFYNAINNGARFDICYTIEENHYRDITSLQLNVRDIKLN